MIQIVKIKKIVESCLEYVQTDFESKNNEKDSFLYKVLGDTQDGSYNFYEQAKNLFLRKETNPNNIKVLLEYPKDRAGLPSYVIREPGKKSGIANSIGKIESFMGGVPMYRDTRQYGLEIMCFSVNMNESILMSEILYALLLGSWDILASQFLKIEFTMKELMMQNNLMPTPIFIRSIGLDLSSEEIVPGLVDTSLLGKIIFGKVNQVDSIALGDPTSIDGLPGVESEIVGFR
ncbi:MAG: hypothetical protein SOY17_09895 [Evtepia sp.]|nr:hypothetical protein [Evtepia sp.]